MSSLLPQFDVAVGNEFVGDVLSALEESFGTKFDVWARSSDTSGSQWACSSEQTHRITTETTLCDNTPVVDLFTTALHNHPGPSVNKLGDGEYLICVPFHESDRTRNLAVSVLHVADEDLMQTLAETWVSTVRCLAEERELTAQYGFEMSACMDATELLQTVASGIQDCSTAPAWTRLTINALIDLRLAIYAETIIFLPEASAADGDHSEMLRDGINRLTEVQCRTLLEFHDPDSAEPVVCNHDAECQQQQRIAGVRSVVIVPVCCAERIGWLIALNKRPQFPPGMTAPDPNHSEFGTAEARLMTVAASLLAVARHQYLVLESVAECAGKPKAGRHARVSVG